MKNQQKLDFYSFVNKRCNTLEDLQKTGSEITVKSRLNLLLSALSISQADLARLTGLSSAVVNHYAKGERRITAKSASKIIQHFQNVNPAWLILGEGEMFLDKTGSAVAVTDTPSREAEAGNAHTITMDYIESLKRNLDDLREERDALRETLTLREERLLSALERQTLALERVLTQLQVAEPV